LGYSVVAVHHGENQASGRLLRELNIRLRRQYARPLPRPVFEDATQDAFLVPLKGSFLPQAGQ
jgi:hypothetical protein